MVEVLASGLLVLLNMLLMAVVVLGSDQVLGDVGLSSAEIYGVARLLDDRLAVLGLLDHHVYLRYVGWVEPLHSVVHVNSLRVDSCYGLSLVELVLSRAYLDLREVGKVTRYCLWVSSADGVRVVGVGVHLAYLGGVDLLAHQLSSIRHLALA